MSNATQQASNSGNDETTRDRALHQVERLGDNPVALVAGGMALGVLVGLVLPRLARERELLEPLGRTLAERATAAAQAAKQAGREEIDSLLPDKDATKERVSALFGNVLEAAKGAAQKA